MTKVMTTLVPFVLHKAKLEKWQQEYLVDVLNVTIIVE